MGGFNLDLNLRLKNIIEIVPICDKIIDVGTDHGYVLIDLIKKNKIKSGIASDNKKGPLDRAKRNASLYKVKDKIEFRLGSGLSTIEKNEVSGAIFAGMGSYLIKDLIEKDIEKIKMMDFVLIQPAQKTEVIREYLYNGPFDIIKEDIIREDDRFYQYILIRYNEDSPLRIDNNQNYKIGKNYDIKKNNLVVDYINFEINRTLNIIKKIKKVNNNTKQKKNCLQNEVKYYEELKNDFKS